MSSVTSISPSFFKEHISIQAGKKKDKFFAGLLNLFQKAVVEDQYRKFEIIDKKLNELKAKRNGTNN